MIKNKMLNVICRIIGVVVLLFSGHVFAVSPEVEKQILTDFQVEFDRVETFAKEHGKPIATDVLMEFIETHMIQHWSAELTIRAIVGKERWKEIKIEEKQQLIDAYGKTMRRYLFETFQQYNGQKPLAEKVELHSNLKKGWLTVKLLNQSSPNLSVDLKIYSRKGKWLIYDFRYQGVSFVQLKGLDYFLTLKINGAKGLIDKLNKKNELFYQGLESQP